MRILIRHVKRTGSEGVERSDVPFEGEVVTVGRAADQIIPLLDRALPLSHSEIRDDGKSLVMRATGDDHFFVNGKRSRATKIVVGDEVEIGEYTIRPIDAPDGYEFAVEVEAGELSESEVSFGTNFRQGLEQTGLSKRGVAWALFVVILVAFLMIPSIGMVDRDVGILMRNMPVLDDGVWDSGPLHASHRFMGEDCTACHVQPFTMVRDQECIACHRSTTHHVDVAVHQVEMLEEARCASCHKEHNEPSVLSRQDQQMCSDCHENLADWTVGELAVADVGDFEDHHPEFKASMLVGSGTAVDYEWSIQRVALDDPALTEQSNLVFPHDVHMDPGGIGGPSGDVSMQCSDCHRPNPGGAYMQPVRMEEHCADCHLLTFDAAFPDRELPHGEPDLIVRLLEEFYARQELVGETAPLPATTSTAAPAGRPTRLARRPGQARATLQRDPEPIPLENLTGADMNRIVAKARRAASDVFERTSCKICHEVDRLDDPAHYSPWQVRPVRIAQVWMPKSWFDHQAHAGEDCGRCHAAEGSSLASDVSMPRIDSCRDCHGGGDAETKLASTCTECHSFHLPGLDLMRPDEPGAELQAQLSDLDQMRPERIDALTPMRKN